MYKDISVHIVVSIVYIMAHILVGVPCLSPKSPFSTYINPFGLSFETC